MKLFVAKAIAQGIGAGSLSEPPLPSHAARWMGRKLAAPKWLRGAHQADAAPRFSSAWS